MEPYVEDVAAEIERRVGTVVERLFRDNRILSIGGGTHEIMNEVIAKQLGL